MVVLIVIGHLAAKYALDLEEYSGNVHRCRVDTQTNRVDVLEKDVDVVLLIVWVKDADQLDEPAYLSLGQHHVSC